MPSGAYPIVFAVNYISTATLSIDERTQTMNDRRQYTCTLKKTKAKKTRHMSPCRLAKREKNDRRPTRRHVVALSLRRHVFDDESDFVHRRLKSNYL